MSNVVLAKNLLGEYIHLTEEYEELILKIDIESKEVEEELDSILVSMTKEEVHELFDFLKHDSDIKFHIFKKRKDVFNTQ